MLVVAEGGRKCGLIVNPISAVFRGFDAPLGASVVLVEVRLAGIGTCDNGRILNPVWVALRWVKRGAGDWRILSSAEERIAVKRGMFDTLGIIFGVGGVLVVS